MDSWYGTGSPGRCEGRQGRNLYCLRPFNTSPDSPFKLILPKNDSFLTWPQTGAIFKAARRPAAAKLYMSWLLSKEMQEGRGL